MKASYSDAWRLNGVRQVGKGRVGRTQFDWRAAAATIGVGGGGGARAKTQMRGRRVLPDRLRARVTHTQVQRADIERESDATFLCLRAHVTQKTISAARGRA